MTANEIHTPPYVVNIGPQHPSTHGVFRMRVTLDGERIIDAEMVLGYLHRSMEKLAEERTYTQNIPFTDRMDYLAAMTGNLGYCLAVEKLAGVEVPERGSYLRVIFAELQRIASHCMANGTFVNDCGAWQTPLMYMFREREKILDLFEMTCGARLTTNYMRIGGVAFDVPDEWYPAVNALIAEMPDRISEYEELLLDNEILLARARDVGVLKPGRRDQRLAPAARCCAPAASPGTCARPTRTASTTAWTSTSPSATTATASTASSSASKRCARACASSSRRWRSCPAGRQHAGAARPEAGARRGLRAHRVAQG